AGMVSSTHQVSPPMDLSWFLRKGCAKHPANRYQSVQEMIERLEKRADGVIPIQCHITFMKRVSTAWVRFLDRHPFIVRFLMALVLALAVAGALSAWGHLRA